MKNQAFRLKQIVELIQICNARGYDVKFGKDFKSFTAVRKGKKCN